jgi:hypothetical protein
MSLRSATSSARRQQEAEVVAAQERERAAAVAAAIAARAARLAAVELAAARAEVEAAEAADAARAAAAELEALLLSTTTPTKSSGWRGKQRESRRHSGQPRIPMGARMAAAQIGAYGAPGEGARGGSPDGRRHAGGAPGGGDRVDGDRGLYRRHDSPSPDRYHGRRMAQAIVRDISPGGGWPTLTKTNYVEWAAVMRVRL